MRSLLVRTLIGASSLAVAAVACAGSAQAEESAAPKAKDMTCEEFLALGTEIQPRVVYWMDGYSKAGKLEESEVDVRDFERPVAVIVTACQKAPKSSVKETVKKHF